jgi:nitroreductase/NAD-dependent dihydropyrimidine dehydrogenase PreA subunit
MNRFKLDSDLCTQCGLCLADCPSQVLEMNDLGYPYMTDEICLNCQHCLAICPMGAIVFNGFEPGNSLELGKDSFPSLEKMEKLMKGRRSVRFFKKEDIPRENINKLLDLAYHAPTGVNRQEISFKVIYSQSKMIDFIESFYSILEKAVLDPKYKEHEGMINRMIKQYREEGKDIYFRNAPHIFFAVGPKEDHLVHSDGVIASTYFELATFSAGYSALWNGYITHVVNSITELRPLLKLKDKEVVCYTLCFGIPDIQYFRTVQRGSAVVEELG